MVSTLVAEKFKSKAFRIGLIVLGVFTVILLGAMFGCSVRNLGGRGCAEGHQGALSRGRCLRTLPRVLTLDNAGSAGRQLTHALAHVLFSGVRQCASGQ